LRQQNAIIDSVNGACSKQPGGAIITFLALVKDGWLGVVFANIVGAFVELLATALVDAL
jgi:hypothetical protein